MSYNGFRNYQTWNVCLWIGNDEGLYNISRECANYEEFQDRMRENGMIETPDNVAWNDSGLDLDAINDVCFSEDDDDVLEPDLTF